MGTRKNSSSSTSASSAGKAAKAGKASGKNAAGKGSKPGSKFSSIKQALFGGGSGKKSSATSGKPSKKTPSKAPSAKGSKQHSGSSSHVAARTHKESAQLHHKSKAKEVAKPVSASKKVESAAPVKSDKKNAHESVRSHGGSAARGSAARGSAARGAKGVAVSMRTSLIESGEAVCREVACEGLATSGGYCRLHYIKNWKKIKRKEVILKEGKLNQYIEELVAKYPDKYIEAIRQDLANDKDFAKVIYDLDLDESLDDFDVESEGSDTIIDSIKRDFDDEGDTGF